MSEIQQFTHEALWAALEHPTPRFTEKQVREELHGRFNLQVEHIIGVEQRAEKAEATLKAGPWMRIAQLETINAEQLEKTISARAQRDKYKTEWANLSGIEAHLGGCLEAVEAQRDEALEVVRSFVELLEADRVTHKEPVGRRAQHVWDRAEAQGIALLADTPPKTSICVEDEDA